VIFMPHPRAVLVILVTEIVSHSVTRNLDHHFTFTHLIAVSTRDLLTNSPDCIKYK